MMTEDISEKMEEYSHFVTQKLRPELDRAELSRNESRAEMNEYRELLQRLTEIQSKSLQEMETMVDLGHQLIYCNAVANLETIFVHTGMGFHVELTIQEAIPFVKKRISFLEKDVLKRKEARVREITQHIVAASAILDELTREWKHLA